MSFRLESTYGQIHSRLPGTVRKTGSRQVMEGTVGDGGARLTLINKSGSIRVRSE